MDALKQVIAKINTQLADLTASQRIAIGLCAVVIVGSFLWLARWSAEPELVRLLEEPMAHEQLSLARQTLPSGKFKIAGDYILVSAVDRQEMLFLLSDAGALPADTSVTFSKLIEDDSPFRPESENKFRRRIAQQNELAKVIAASPRVRTAEVFISDTTERRINAPNVVPTASIRITMVPGQPLDQDTVRACAYLVSGAVPGLVPHNVSIIDGTTLQPHKIPDPKDAMAQGRLQEKKKQEDHLRDKIIDQLSYVVGVRVNVSVLLDSAKKEVLENSYAEPAVSEEMSSSATTQAGRPSGEAGVGPNVGQSLAGGPSGTTNSTDESSTKFQNQPLVRQTKTEHLPFAVLRATASVGIPRSYAVGVLMSIGGAESEPNDEEINTWFAAEKARIHTAVKNIIMAKSDSDVTVDLFPDLDRAVTVLADGTVAMGSGMAVGGIQDSFREYGPQAGLVGLALVSLAMLVGLAKRSSREAAEFYKSQRKDALEDDGDEELLTVGAKTVGMASPTEGSMLQAREVDEDLLHATELTEQVKAMVNDDPVAVAQMLRTWTDVNE